jgi:two-component system sensor kinase FixL
MGTADQLRGNEEARLRQLVDATQDAVVFIDEHARIRRLNRSAERIFGYAPGELLGQKVDVLMPEPYRAQHDDYIRRYERTGEARAVGRIRRVEAVRKDGVVFPIELSVTELEDDEIRYAAFIRDVSVSVELQRQVMHTEKLTAVGGITAKLAHEIANPLNNVMIQMKLLDRCIQASSLGDETLDDCVRAMYAELDRLRRLLDEFRLLSRRDQLHQARSELGPIITEVAHMVPSLGGDIAVSISLAKDVPAVNADPDKLKQVLLNLALNAVEAMPAGGDLRFELVTDEARDNVFVRVSDTGSGIPEDVDVFEPFVTTKPMGTGLGLAVARQLVAAHHGRLTHAPADGGGTVFTVELPLDG